MTLTESFVAAIEESTGRVGLRHGAETRLLCPAHDDHRPSLDVREGANGAPLVTCRSHGCSFEAICAALGREPHDFVPPGRGGSSSASRIAATPQHTLTLAEYATAKQIPVALLREWG